MSGNDFDYKAAFEDAQNQLVFYKQQEIQLSQALDCPVGSIVLELNIIKNRIKSLEVMLKEAQQQESLRLEINGKSYEIRASESDE